MPKAGWKKNPDTGNFEPPTTVGEVAVAAPRKRHDPGESPVDGFYRYDQVINKDPSKRYYLCSDEDALIKQAMGATMTERRTGGPRPFFDRGSDADSGYKVRGLTLFEMPEALAREHDARNVEEMSGQLAVIRNQVRRTPGGEFVDENVSA
jgi:hypothetical protein